jgi:hypothetical protein
VRQRLILCLLVLGACTSTWDKHRLNLEDAASRGDMVTAVREQQWLIDHASRHAPKGERGPQAQVDRHLELARLSVRGGAVGDAIEALRLALQADPTRYDEITTEVMRLPLSAEQLQRLDAEFRWNRKALLPNLNLTDDVRSCWSYRVREIRVRRTEIRQGLAGSERVTTYDARSWVFDAGRESWRADGDWVEDIGAETERVFAAQRPRYRAILAADRGFFFEGPLPPCHREGWTGPFDPERDRLFVTRHLPGNLANE